MDKTDEGFVAVSHGDRLFYERLGDGPCVILLPNADLMTDSRVWDDQMAFLSQFRTVIRYDDRGFGRSSPWGGPYRRYEDAVQVIRTLNIEETALMGEHGGAGTALEVAVALKETVSELVLIGPSIPGLAARLILADQRANVVRTGIELARSMFPHLDEGVRSGDFGPHVEDMVNMIEGLSDDQRSRIRAILLDNSPNLKPDRLGFLMNEKSMDPPIGDRLTEVEARTLMVLAASEDETAQRIQGMVLDEVPNVEKVVLPKWSFCLTLEDPEKLNEVLGDFLA